MENRLYTTCRLKRHSNYGGVNCNFLFVLFSSGKNNNPLQPAPKNIKLNVYRCFFEKCIVPTPPPPPDGRPENFVLWSKAPSWVGAPAGYGGADGRIPQNGNDVIIMSEWWMVFDMEETVTLDRLYVYGVLEFGNQTFDQVLKANIILISGLSGQLIVGFPDAPVLSNVLISLTGNHDSKDMPLNEDLNLGSKALGVFGLLRMYGRRHNVHWTRLNQTVAAGGTQISVEETVDWETGDEIVITTSSFRPEEAEKFTITEILDDGKTLKLNKPAQFMHTAFNKEINKYQVKMSAKVGLLSRNLKIEGANEPARSLDDQSFGCRVLVGQYGGEGGIPYRGKAELSEVQFSHCGQYGWTESYDPRFVYLPSIFGEILYFPI